MMRFLSSFATYALLTIALASISVWHAFHTRKQFFPATIFLTTNKINVVVLSNVAFMLTLSFGKFLKYIFLGELSGQEVTEIERKGKIAVTETCLALTTFREELNIRMVALFTILLFVKMFHWLARMRINNVSVRTMNFFTHLRLSLLTLLLAISDVGFVTLITWGMLKQKGPSVLLLFAFEFMILGVMITISAAKYLLFVNSAGSEGEPVRCCVKNVWLFYLDFTADLLRLFLLLIFFMIICTYYGLPIHLIREIWVTFYGLRDRILKFIQYRRLLRVLDHFPKATEEEMKDTICTICQDEMEDAIKLPCGHVFHKHCLHSWLFYDQRCPNCQTPISISMNMVNGEPEPAPNQAQQGAPAQNIPSAPASEQKSNASPAVESKKPVYARNPYWAPPTVAPAPTPTGEFIAPVQQTAPLPHIPFMIPSGISYGQPLTGASKEVLLRVSQRQTLMLQQHVDFLQSQLASTFQMLQQQLSLQEQLMKTQTTQEMATKLNSENKTTVQTDGKKDEKVLDEKHGAGADILGNENSSAAEEKEVISTVMKETSLEAHESDAAGKIRAARLQKFNSLSRQSTLEKDEKE